MLDKEKLLARLESEGIDVQTHEHNAVFTVEEGLDLHAKLPGAHSKNLFVKDKKKRYFLITARHDTEIDLKQLHKLIGGKGRLSFGTAEYLMQYLGVEPGSVTPFAIANDQEGAVTMILDQALFEFEMGNYHPLINTATTAINNEDLVSFLRNANHDPIVMDVSKYNPKLSEQD